MTSLVTRAKEYAARFPEADTVVFGVLPAVVAMPLILRVWAPNPAVAAWTICYFVVSMTFVVMSARGSVRSDVLWSAWEGLMFALVPISAVSWGTSEHFWMATAVGFIYIAFALSELPFFDYGRGWFGPVLVCLAIAVCGFFVVHWVLALMMVPLFTSIITGANQVRDIRLRLEHHLEIAEDSVVHDPLTGLLNRRGLSLVARRLEGHEITVALVDVDRFKLINDTYGHQIGDQVLMAIAQQLQDRFGTAFEMARLGGDEFVAIGGGATGIDAEIAAPIAVTMDYHQHPLRIACSLSVGVSRGSGTGGAERLMSEAGFAMREVKRVGGGLASFQDGLLHRFNRTIEVAAIANDESDVGEFVPVTQLIMSNSGVVGCELLVRWHRADGEIVMPSDFLPMARETGLMAMVNNLMLEHAVLFAARFNNRPVAPFVSVNISALHLGSANFRQRVEDLLRVHRVPPERLMLEITETEQLGGYTEWEVAAVQLRALGVRLAMDDFGSGYSSLARLQNLPISHLKFDASLVRSASGPFGEVIAGVSRFARAVNIGLIAEGLETLDQVETMRAMGVDTYQGFLFHEPESLDAAEIKIIEGIRASSYLGGHRPGTTPDLMS